MAGSKADVFPWPGQFHNTTRTAQQEPTVGWMLHVHATQQIAADWSAVRYAAQR